MLIIQSNSLEAVNNFMALATIDHKKASEYLLSEIKEGNVSPLKMKLAIKRLEEMLKTFKEDKEVETTIINDVKKALGNAKTVEMFGAKLSVAPTYTTYDFSNTNDIFLAQLKTIEQTIKELIKNREDSLKTITVPAGSIGIASRTEVIEKLPVIDWIDCGEEVVLRAPIKIQKEGVKISFIKD